MIRYRRSFATTVKQTSQRRRRTSRRGRTPIFVVGGFALLVLIGLLYVGQVNTVATSGIVIRDLEERISDLQQINQELDLSANDLRALSTIERSSKDLNLTVRAQAAYLPLVTDTVARGQ